MREQKNKMNVSLCSSVSPFAFGEVVTFLTKLFGTGEAANWQLLNPVKSRHQTQFLDRFCVTPCRINKLLPTMFEDCFQILHVCVSWWDALTREVSTRNMHECCSYAHVVTKFRPKNDVHRNTLFSQGIQPFDLSLFVSCQKTDSPIRVFFSFLNFTSGAKIQMSTFLILSFQNQFLYHLYL